MRILITGSTGFAGGHLAEALLARGNVELYGTSLRGAWSADCRHLDRQVQLKICDLCDREAVTAVVREVRPEQVYHLAGYAHAGRSMTEPEAAWAGNLLATRNLYDSLAKWQKDTRILFVGSGLVYGDQEATSSATDELAPLRPANPYASSKAAADLTSYQYTRHPGLDIVRVRPFNHIGPRQSAEYAVPHFAKQIAAIERGALPPLLETGDLRPRRDLMDVRDMVQAYILLMEHGRSGEVYNAATGEAHAMHDVIDRLQAQTKVRIEVKQQGKLLRAAETQRVCGDASRLRTVTGWQPRFTLDQTLTDILNYWRQQP